MKRYDIMASEDETVMLRILEIQKDRLFVIDCLTRAMPVFMEPRELEGFHTVKEIILFERTGCFPTMLEKLSPVQRKKALERYTVIAPVLAVLSDVKARKGRSGL